MYDESHLASIRSIKLKNGDLVDVESLDLFDNQFSRLGLDEADRNVLELTILAGNVPSVIVQGSGGVRKIRFAPPGSNIGKRGAYRVFYLPLIHHKYLCLMGILSKREEDNFSKAQRNALATMAVRLEAYAKRRSSRK